jgi:hypothetical protein
VLPGGIGGPQAPFIGRERELKLLQRLWQSQKAELLILYGRQKVGNTRLLTRWLEIDRPRALFWVGELTSAYDQLRSFSQALYNFANPGLPAPDNFTYASVWYPHLRSSLSLANLGLTTANPNEPDNKS